MVVMKQSREDEEIGTVSDEEDRDDSFDSSQLGVLEEPMKIAVDFAGGERRRTPELAGIWVDLNLQLKGKCHHFTLRKREISIEVDGAPRRRRRRSIRRSSRWRSVEEIRDKAMLVNLYKLVGRSTWRQVKLSPDACRSTTDGEDLLRVAEKEGDDDVEEVGEELAEKLDEYFGEDTTRETMAYFGNATLAWCGAS
ncbi:hypothetical protein ISN44_As10g025450 [Arabidopsis suecica]|uniref:Uncharacterized protein n=1 Tax=Arabidopsis suecica TaxID=45249 RepID=A0A8T2A132_ARASU|nr:hypothetical protein ISN44_As10g025450 [Arabidopsis suecica]